MAVAVPTTSQRGKAGSQCIIPLRPEALRLEFPGLRGPGTASGPLGFNKEGAVILSKQLNDGQAVKRICITITGADLKFCSEVVLTMRVFP